MMIVREWRGRARFDKADVYPSHFRARVAPELRKIPGFIGAELLRRRAPDGIEFLVLTRWRSIEAIRAFTGDDIDRAVVEPDAAAALYAFEKTALHYETIDTLTL
jgi:heme-degrading monooxygenase HmoA